MKLGDVFYVECDDLWGNSHVQRGRRPVVVWQNNIGNQYSQNVVVIPLTTSIKRRDIPTHVVIDAVTSGLYAQSMALCENPMTIPMDRLSDYVTHLPKKTLVDIAEATIIASSGIALMDEERIDKSIRKAKTLL